MFTKLLKPFTLISIVTLLTSCNTPSLPSATSTTPTATPTAKGVLVLADISNNPTKKIKRYQPLADYLATHLQQFNIGIGEVKIAPDLKTMVNWLKAGKVDIYFDSPYPAMIVSDQSGAQPILRRWKGGDAQYYGVIFTMKDEGISSLANLKGKTIAFDESSSTSGYLLPMAVFLKAGLKPIEKASADAKVNNDEIGYVFSDDDENTIQWVISGKVSAGAVDVASFSDIPQETRDSMKILATTEKVARHIVMVRPNMNPEQIQAIQKLLIEMDKTPEGKAILKTFEDTAKFDKFPTEDDLLKMRQLYELVQKQ
jgi:phosphonate transport system substrate-binding protein